MLIKDADLPIFPPMVNIGGKLYSFEKPWVMGILNVTPDSFYSASRHTQIGSIRERIIAIRDEGADCIDIGACSTRPGAYMISEKEEWSRLIPALEILREEWPEAVLSVDTFRASIARKSIERFKAAIINDISGGTMDEKMFDTIAELKAAYVLMHLRGTPENMQKHVDYSDVSAEVLKDLAFKAAQLRRIGVCNIIIDPGFGFAKDTAQNYRLLDDLEEFTALGYPVLVGMSRKSMIWHPLSLTPEDALPGTLTLHTVAMMKGASIIRAHDVAAARQSADVFALLKAHGRTESEKTEITILSKEAFHMD